MDFWGENGPVAQLQHHWYHLHLLARADLEHSGLKVFDKWFQRTSAILWTCWTYFYKSSCRESLDWKENIQIVQETMVFPCFPSFQFFPSDVGASQAKFPAIRCTGGLVARQAVQGVFPLHPQKRIDWFVYVCVFVWRGFAPSELFFSCLCIG